MAGGVLDGRVAVVTGAGRGNGAAIARGLALAGATVVVSDVDGDLARQSAAAIGQDGGTSSAATLDVRDAAACDRLARDIEARHGKASILVNNAGVLLRGRLSDGDVREKWRTTLDVNLDGTFNVTMAFLGQIKATKGSIVNVASIQSFVTPPNSAAYSASKGAIAQFTRALANELAPHGARANAIAPGIIETEMTTDTRADPERLRQYLTHVPMRRCGLPEELAGPVVFLCSDAASYMTGVVMPVDGGYLSF
ncbi:MAG: SDR family oxidoreductase [Alphaproteobacteria bacterium]|nr:SDR family oxidoreductase [Alphaproteobacteria bacterium]